MLGHAEDHDETLKDGIAGMILVGKGHAIFDDLVVEEIR
jgi:hypothetical protein